MSARSTTGCFVRWDLMTGDTEAAEGFYTALFGWAVEKRSMGGFTMRSVANAGETIGGIVPLDTTVMPAHWMSYVAVDDIEATCAAAQAAGGTVCVPPTTVPGLGRFAVLEDPAGGYFSAVALAAPVAVHDTAPVGHFAWSNLACSAPDAVAPFYRALFGWRFEALAGQAMPTWQVSHAGAPIASMMQKPPGVPGRDAWLPYVAVADCAAAEARAQGLGAKVWVGTTKLAGMGSFAVLSDPTGAQLALWENERAG